MSSNLPNTYTITRNGVLRRRSEHLRHLLEYAALLREVNRRLIEIERAQHGH